MSAFPSVVRKNASRNCCPRKSDPFSDHRKDIVGPQDCCAALARSMSSRESLDEPRRRSKFRSMSILCNTQPAYKPRALIDHQQSDRFNVSKFCTNSCRTEQKSPPISRDVQCMTKATIIPNATTLGCIHPETILSQAGTMDTSCSHTLPQRPPAPSRRKIQNTPSCLLRRERHQKSPYGNSAHQSQQVLGYISADKKKLSVSLLASYFTSNTRCASGQKQTGSADNGLKRPNSAQDLRLLHLLSPLR